MTNAIEIAEKIRDKISELPEAKEYARLKEIIDKDVEIQEMQKEILALQKCGKTEEAEELMDRLNAMPIVMNFQSIKELLADALKVISNILK